MSYIKPEKVISPRQNWTMIAVLDEGREGSTSLALGKWKHNDGTEGYRLGMRWNGRDDNPVGNPQSRGLPTWFLLEEKYHEVILNSGLITSEKVTLARNFLPAPTPSRMINNPQYMEFYRSQDTQRAILEDLTAGEKHYNPNRTSSPFMDLGSLERQGLVEQVKGATEVTYCITEDGQEMLKAFSK